MLEEILAKSPKEWSNQDYAVIAKAQKEKGRAYVQKLRDDILAATQ